eukprot:13218363-Alexandrium_andersonii.AAC.1
MGASRLRRSSARAEAPDRQRGGGPRGRQPVLPMVDRGWHPVWPMVSELPPRAAHRTTPPESRSGLAL